jgi:uncharacterized membrane protein
MLPNHYKNSNIGIVMITETFLKIMVGGAAVLILVSIVVLAIKLGQHQREVESRQQTQSDEESP